MLIYSDWSKNFFTFLAFPRVGYLFHFVNQDHSVFLFIMLYVGTKYCLVNYVRIYFYQRKFCFKVSTCWNIQWILFKFKVYKYLCLLVTSLVVPSFVSFWNSVFFNSLKHSVMVIELGFSRNIYRKNALFF